MARFIVRPELDSIFPARPNGIELVSAVVQGGTAYSIERFYYFGNVSASRVWWARTLCNALRKNWIFANVEVQGSVNKPDGFQFMEGEWANNARKSNALYIIRKYVSDVEPKNVDPTTLTEAKWIEIEVLASARDRHARSQPRISN